MKKVLLFLSACLALSAQAATTTPVQLLNPAGSTAGQAIVSTGPSTAPGWATVTAGALAPIAANTVLGNFTASSAAPAAFAVPSCSTANSALKYTSGTGLSCGTTFALTSGNLSQFAATTSAQLLGVISDETGSGALVFGTSPSLATPTIAGAALSGTFSGTPSFSGAVTFTSTITPSQTAGIVGTTTNNNANAGSVGEHITATGTGVSLTTATAANITSISLTAGDWEVDGSVLFQPAGTTQVSVVNAGASSTTATLPAIPLYSQANNQGTGLNIGLVIPRQRFSLSGTTTVFLVAASTFTVSTMTATGTIRARRVR